MDHFAIDLAGRRLFVSALGANTIEVLDLKTGARVMEIRGQTEPQGLAWLPERRELVAASADGQVGVYGGDDLKRLALLKLGDDADNVRIDDAGRPVIGYGAGALATIDPVSRRAVAMARLPAHPESFRIDGKRAFVNVPNARQTAVVDLASGAVIATWPTPGPHWNYPMALDKAQGVLAIADRLPPRLRLLDTSTGRAVLETDVCGDSDDLFFDEKRRRIYVICGSGDVDVFQAASGAGYARIARVATRNGARTGLFVPEDDRLYVAARAGGGQPAAILVYRPAP
jgi:DNA-binding beta-propeller fold protein YncE